MDYPSNSDKSKMREENDIPSIDHPVNGNVKLRKKTRSKLASKLFAEDISNVKDFVWKDIIKPKIMDIVYYTISDSAEMLLFGDSSRSRSRSDPRSGVGRDYTRFSDRRRSDTNSTRTRPRRGYNLDDIILDSRGEAERVLDELESILDRYNYATVANLYGILQLTPPDFTCTKYGWDNLDSADFVRDREGYRLKLPTPVYID